MRSVIFSVIALGMLSACAAPADVAYCEKMGTPQGHAEHFNCMDYFHKQTAWFNADLSACNNEADMTYPQSLYDYGGRQHARVYGGYGMGGYGPHGGFGGSRHVYVEMEPDYQKNAQVDALRQRIIQPCMQSRGWNSSYDWEAGRAGR